MNTFVSAQVCRLITKQVINNCSVHLNSTNTQTKTQKRSDSRPQTFDLYDTCHTPLSITDSYHVIPAGTPHNTESPIGASGNPPTKILKRDLVPGPPPVNGSISEPSAAPPSAQQQQPLAMAMPQQQQQPAEQQQQQQQQQHQQQMPQQMQLQSSIMQEQQQQQRSVVQAGHLLPQGVALGMPQRQVCSVRLYTGCGHFCKCECSL